MKYSFLNLILLGLGQSPPIYLFINIVWQHTSFWLKVDSCFIRRMQVLLLAASLALASATPVLKLDDLEYGFCPGSPEPGTFDSAKVSCDWWRAGHVTAAHL